MRTNLLILLAIFTASMVGCAHLKSERTIVRNLNFPLTVLQSTVEQSLPAGKRKVSTNGREFYSEYFISDGQNFRLVQKPSFRMYAKVTVLGDRRPFDLEVVVYRERRIEGDGVNNREPASYEVIGDDQRLAKVVMSRISETLAKRREDRNFIDDFRVF